jgi:hypothetical protein
LQKLADAGVGLEDRLQGKRAVAFGIKVQRVCSQLSKGCLLEQWTDCTDVVMTSETAQGETVGCVVLVMKIERFVLRKTEIDEVLYTLSPLRAEQAGSGSPVLCIRSPIAAEICVFAE